MATERHEAQRRDAAAPSVRDVVLRTLNDCELKGAYTNEQTQLQPDLRDALEGALRDRFGEGFTVQVSVNEGRPANEPKPHVDLLGTNFWPDLVVKHRGVTVIGIEAKYVRVNQSAAKPISETIGQCMIYALRYDRVVAFVLHHGLYNPSLTEDDDRFLRLLADNRVDLVLRRA